mgnify:CR=1 FL=1
MNVIDALTPALCGMFKFEAFRVDENGNEISRRTVMDWTPNMIVDNGKNLLGSGGNFLSYISIGSSNVPPNSGQNALISYIASTSGTVVNIDGVINTSPYYSYSIITKRFTAAPTNWTINEVGIGPNNNGTNLFSRALTVDSLGVPTTLNILAGEILDVTYQIRCYPPIGSDVTGTITISGVNYNYTLRACRVGFSPNSGGGWGSPYQVDAWPVTFSQVVTVFTGSIGDITSSPSGTTAGVNSGYTDLTYTPGNFYRDHQIVIDLASGNITGGIKSIMYNFRWGCYQIEFSTAIPKSASNILTLVFRHAWAT